MSIEKGRSVMEAAPEAEELSPSEITDQIRLAASDDEKLAEQYETIMDLVDNYAIAKMRHVQYAERNQTRIQLDQRYQDRFNDMNENREEAHNRLIESLGQFARRAQRAGKDTAWFNGPGGLMTRTSRRLPRQRVDDWAMDVWLEREEHSAPGPKPR